MLSGVPQHFLQINGSIGRKWVYLFMRNVEKRFKILLKSCGVNTAEF